MRSLTRGEQWSPQAKVVEQTQTSDMKRQLEEARQALSLFNKSTSQ